MSTTFAALNRFLKGSAASAEPVVIVPAPAAPAASEPAAAAPTAAAPVAGRTDAEINTALEAALGEGFDAGNTRAITVMQSAEAKANPAAAVWALGQSARTTTADQIIAGVAAMGPAASAAAAEPAAVAQAGLSAVAIAAATPPINLKPGTAASENGNMPSGQDTDKLLDSVLGDHEKTMSSTYGNMKLAK